MGNCAPYDWLTSNRRNRYIPPLGPPTRHPELPPFQNAAPRPPSPCHLASSLNMSVTMLQTPGTLQSAYEKQNRNHVEQVGFDALANAKRPPLHPQHSHRSGTEDDPRHEPRHPPQFSSSTHETPAAVGVPPEAHPAQVQERLSDLRTPSLPGPDDAWTPSLDVANYKTADILLMLAGLLQKITARNDRLGMVGSTAAAGQVPHHTTTTIFLAFHARNIPSISIHNYLLRILRYCPTSNEIFISLLVYFDRMSRRVSAGFLPGGGALDKDGLIVTNHYTFAIDSFNVHRLIIAAVTVASKFSSDVFYTNSRYAKVRGVGNED